MLDITSIHFNTVFYVALFRIYFYQGNIFVMCSNDMPEIFPLFILIFRVSLCCSRKQKSKKLL